jgi:hypothetical protein
VSLTAPFRILAAIEDQWTYRVGGDLELIGDAETAYRLDFNARFALSLYNHARDAVSTTAAAQTSVWGREDIDGEVGHEELVDRVVYALRTLEVGHV